jgi:hypothetical protein
MFVNESDFEKKLRRSKHSEKSELRRYLESEKKRKLGSKNYSP